MRVVLDTNVFISGIFWEGNFCSQIINAWKEKKFYLVSSIELIEELIKTLKYFKIQMLEEIIEEWRNLIISNSILVECSNKIDIIKEDPEDNRFLEAAIAGKADLIVSQDKHLLNLKEYDNIKILKPEEAILML